MATSYNPDHRGYTDPWVRRGREFTRQATSWMSWPVEINMGYIYNIYWVDGWRFLSWGYLLGIYTYNYIYILYIYMIHIDK